MDYTIGNGPQNHGPMCQCGGYAIQRTSARGTLYWGCPRNPKCPGNYERLNPNAGPSKFGAQRGNNQLRQANDNWPQGAQAQQQHFGPPPTYTQVAPRAQVYHNNNLPPVMPPEYSPHEAPVVKCDSCKGTERLERDVAELKELIAKMNKNIEALQEGDQ